MSYYTEAYVEKQLAAIERVRELHNPAIFGYETYCSQCYGEYEQNYPCDTIKVLDGEQQ